MKIEKILKEKGRYEEISSVFEDWPEEVYKKTEISKTETETFFTEDCALILDPQHLDKKNQILRVVNKFDGLREMIRECDGQADFLEPTSKLKSKKKETKAVCRVGYVFPVTIEEFDLDADLNKKIY